MSVSSLASTDNNNPLNTYFTFTNDTHFVLTNLRYKFAINGIFGVGNVVSNVQQIVGISGQLNPGHSDTEKQNLLGVNSQNFQITMTAGVYYRPKFWFFTWEKHDNFNFVSVQTNTGYMWIEKDIVTPTSSQ